MLAVVKAPPMPGTKKPVSFRVEGENIPPAIFAFVRALFPDASICKDENDCVKVDDLAWYKKAKAQATPSGNLKMLRTTFKFTQAALAKKAGITVQQISDMEHARIPIGRTMAHRLADALGTSYTNLFW